MKAILNIRKNNFRMLLMAVFAAVAGYGIYAGQKSEIAMSDLMLENVEALANGESGQKLDCWEDISSNGGNVLPTHITYCGTCGPILARSWGDQSMCNN